MAYIRGRQRTHVQEEGAKAPSHRADIDVEKLKKAHAELEQAYKEIRESQIEIILHLAIAAESKDPDTGNHILRLADYAAEIACAIGMDEEEIEVLRWATPMHDIGKIGIPDRILQKPGKLDPEEWEVMKQHTTIGSRMFQNSKAPLLKVASVIARTHHEKYDGSGYPAGLKGEEIPIYGRIVTLVDIFDAIVSKRCYKTEWSFEDGVKHIQSLAGTTLDPKLVDAFMKRLPNIKKIYSANIQLQKFVQDGSVPTQHDIDLCER